MKILRVLTRPNGGGPVRHLGALERELGALGVESRFVVGRCRPGEVDRIQDLRAAGARPERLHVLHPGFWPSDLIAAARKLSRIVDDFGPDLIHSHTAVAGAAARMAAPPGLPCVHTFHGHTLRGGYWGPVRGALVRTTERRLARRTAVIVAVAARVRDELRAAGLQPQHGWMVLPPAPDPLPPGPPAGPARRALRLPAEAPLLLFAGRLEKVKGLDLLLAAMAAAPPGGALARAELLVCGEGREGARLRRAAAALGERVHFLGWREDLSLPLAAADLVVLPSRNEGWPLILADAAAAGRAALATDVGGNAEALARFGNGRLVPPEDPAALAAALEDLLQDSGARAALAAAGPGRASGWGPAAAAARHLELYEALTRGDPAGPWEA